MSKHSEKPSDINWFQRCWDLGYHNLLPVVPPTGGISNAGKRPGVLVAGKWIGKASKEFTATEETCRLWHEMGASVGLSCNGTGLCGVDIDTLTPRWVDHVLGLAHEMLGPAPRRIGRAPKVLLPYNCPVEMRYAQVRFNDTDGRPVLHRPDRPSGRLAPGLVETLAGDAKWFVACGVHPQTRQRYAWPDGLPPRSELTTITQARRDLFMEQLRIELPEALRLMSGGGGVIAPEKLRGPLGLVAEAMRAMPNDPAVVGYDQWRNVAIALRGAVDYSDGLELFQEWTDKAGIDKPTELAHRVFASIESARELGADYIYHQAEKAGWTGFASRWFIEPDALDREAVEAPYESIFGGEADGADKLGVKVIRASEWYGQPVPQAEFLDERDLFPLDGMTNLTGPGASGKTLLLIQLAIAAVTGTKWMGKGVRQGKVLFLSTEDNDKELNRRSDAICRAEGLSLASLDDLVFLDVTQARSAIMMTSDGMGPVGLTDLHRFIVGLVEQHKPVAVILDNRGQIVGGNEIFKGVAVGVCRTLNAIGSGHRCAVILLSHPSNAGLASGSGNSGNTGWLNTPRASLLFRKPKDGEMLTDSYYNEEDDGIRELIVNKRNYGRMGVRINMVWRDGRYVCTDDLAAGRVDQADKARDIFLKLLDWHARQGLTVSPKVLSGNYGPKLFSRHKQGERISTARFKDAMDDLLDKGVLETFTGRGPNRHRNIQIRRVRNSIFD